jgi:hypothetical protein
MKNERVAKIRAAANHVDSAPTPAIANQLHMRLAKRAS